MEEPFIECKVVIIGYVSVGKTSLMSRIINDYVDNGIKPTIGASYMSKTFSTEKGKVKMQIWDTSGQDRSLTVIPMYVRDSSIVLFVYSVDSNMSIQNIEKWYDDLQRTAPNANLILVGNKIDLENREITKEQGQHLANKFHAQFFEISALQNTGVTELFNAMTDIATNQYDQQTTATRRRSATVITRPPETPKKRSFC